MSYPENNSDTDEIRQGFLQEMGMHPKPAPVNEHEGMPDGPPSVHEANTFDAGGGFFRIKKEQPPLPDSEDEEPSEPLFPDVEDSEDEEPEKGKKGKPEKKGLTLQAVMKARNHLQGELLNWIAKSDNPERYMMDEWEMEALVEAYEPYADIILDKFPTWLPLLIMEAKVIGRLTKMAQKDREANIRNQKAAKNEPVRKAKIVPIVTKKPRTRFKLHEAAGMEGYYKEDRHGNYIRKGEYANAEKPDLSNPEEMEQVIFSNGWSYVKDLFNLPDDWAEKMGITIEDE